uniref:Uncharacterized protein LOC114342862 n=1 Tax=Diabrotica virgifera virgifera TaxID=50390 RepID=A0A6P7GTV8_DIAVI
MLFTGKRMREKETMLVEGPMFVGRQDNARPHIARETIEFIQESGIVTLEWLSRLADLSTIEHVWNNMVGRNINHKSIATSSNKLRRPVACHKNLDEYFAL